MNFYKKKIRSWKESLSAVLHPRVITMFFFGISAGLPLLLIFSSLSLWLREAGVDRSAVTFFSWAALGYSFKFIWAPVVDIIPVFFLSGKFGRRRGWIIFSQLMVVCSVCMMALTDPSKGESFVYLMGFAAVCLGFSAATQDIVIDAYRIECAEEELQAMLASSYIAGYRIGMLIAGAGALFAADFFGSGLGHYNYPAWRNTYFIMSLFMLTGLITAFVIPEPELKQRKLFSYNSFDYLGAFLCFIISVIVFIVVFYFSSYPLDYIKPCLDFILVSKNISGFTYEGLRLFLGIFSAFMTAWGLSLTGLVNKRMVKETYIEPVKDFFTRYGLNLSILLLSLIGLYRISDIVLGVISNLFYQDIGFSKTQIAGVVKTFGLFMTIAGGFIGGIFSARFGVIKILFAGALLSSLTNLLFMLMAYTGNNMIMLYIVISADNLAGGIATAAFVAFLSSLTNIRFTAVQYAVFSSLMTLVPKLFGGYSGTVVDRVGYETFFLITAVIGIPVLILIWYSGKYLEIKD